MARLQPTTLEGTKFSELAQGYIDPKAEEYETIEAFLEPSNIIGDVITAYVDELNRVTRMWRDASEDYIGESQLRLYVNTLLWIRVQYCNNQLSHEYRDELMHRLQVPVFISAILDSIGKVTDDVYGLEIVPVLPDGFEKEILTPAVAMETSRKLRQVLDDGFKTVEGILRDKTGVLDFMALTVSDGLVRSYKKGSKVYGLLAALFTRLCQSEAMGLVPRIKFGQVAKYRMDILTLLDDKTNL